jgi:hypothetical protein
MLFDLRSRGRRRTVRVIYLGLALLMGGGLVLFGVGTGNGNGGLLNGLSNSGSGGGAQHQVVSQAERAALTQVKAHPSSPSAWSSLIQADWSAANQSPDFNSTTGVYSAAGRRALTQTTQAYARYASLVKQPDPNVSILAARADVILKNWPAAASAWQNVAVAEGNAPNAFLCWSVTAQAAGNTRIASLAAAKATALVPSASRLQFKQELKAAEAAPTTAAAQDC